MRLIHGIGYARKPASRFSRLGNAGREAAMETKLTAAAGGDVRPREGGIGLNNLLSPKRQGTLDTEVPS